MNKKQLSEDKIKEILCYELNMCPWIECFGRLITIRKSALKEISTLIKKQLNNCNGIYIDKLNKTYMFSCNMNVMVNNIITTYQTPDESLYICEKKLSKITINEFIYDEKESSCQYQLCLIPVHPMLIIF